VAHIAYYPRGDHRDDADFMLFRRRDRITILKLAALLRLADALDRGHHQSITDFSLELRQDTLVIKVQGSYNTVLEKIALEDKATIFESVFGYKVRINV
jgi:exopolyphosphatase/guanosine-5'-triphosphate,3'-diphosphate pyrophosphatase